ncbi:nucleotide pyrophosphohydrolase [Thermodesulfobacteriota bacterium]
MQKLIKKVRAFARDRDWEQFHSPKNLAMALSVEVAEVVEHFQWLTQEESNRLDPAKINKIREEIGDVLIYLARLADRLGIDPVQAAEEKMRINEKKYPVEKAKGLAAKYTEL